MATELARYYAARAAVYEQIYAKPERQADLAHLKRWLPAVFQGRRVLEIACGTGYWTAVLAQTAAHIVATDLTEATLAVARAKGLRPDVVAFREADAYALGHVAGRFDAAFAGFWWSHVPRQRLRDFLAALHGRLGPAALVVFVDNRFVHGSSTPIARADADGNTYQARTLPDGVSRDVIKNFPDPHDVRGAIEEAGGVDVAVDTLTYFWMARYHTGRRDDRAIGRGSC